MSNFEDLHGVNIKALSTSDFESSDSFKIPHPSKRAKHRVYPSSCDGLICLLNDDYSGMVVNPTTRWHRSFPPPMHQQLILENGYCLVPPLGFGKDKIDGKYKLVCLYNSSELGLENATTCEIFDFSTNSWRYVTPSSPNEILDIFDPVYADGSLYWFTDDYEHPKLLSLDLHSETFQVMSELPPSDIDDSEFEMFNLNNRLCILFGKVGPDQVIWSFDSSNETWTKMYSIVLNKEDECSHCTFSPQAVLGTNKLLYSSVGLNLELHLHDPETKSTDDLVFIYSSAVSLRYCACYFESLVSIL